MIEPGWWVELIQYLNGVVSHSVVYYNIAAFFADVPVFAVPLFLLWLYIWRWIVKHEHSSKFGALYILSAAIVTTLICLIIQHLVDKARPETALTSAWSLIMKHLPTRSFPSDHAAVSWTIAIAALIRWKKRTNRKIQAWWRVLLACSVLMSRARVTVGVHWPTDILMWWIVWTIWALCIFRNPIRRTLKKYILVPVVRIEETILHQFGVYRKKQH